MIENEPVSKLLLRERGRMRKTQKEMSNILGVNYDTYKAWENGKQKPTKANEIYLKNKLKGVLKNDNI